MTHAKELYPNTSAMRSRSELINEVFSLTGAAMTTAVQAATNIATLRSGIEGLVVHAKHVFVLKQLSAALQYAFDEYLFGATVSASNTAIAALTTVADKTVLGATDLEWLTCTKYDAGAVNIKDSSIAPLVANP